MESGVHSSQQGRKREKERLVWIDLLKTVSIFAVILLHCAAPLLVDFEGGSDSWWTGNFYDSAVRWSVPVFVMVSGALLLGRAGKESVSDFLRRRMARVALPFLVWSVLYFEWQIWFWNADHSYGDLIPMLLREPIAYHLWFLYMLLGLYLLAPLLGRIFASERSRSEWTRVGSYAVGAWVIWAGVLPLAQRLLGWETWYTPGRDNTPLMLVGYFLLGFLLRDVAFGRAVKVVVPVVLLAAFGATAWWTFLLTRAAGEFQPLFYEYYSLNVMLMSVAVFIGGACLPGLRSAPASSGRARIWRFLSVRVFGIYLVHVLVLDLFKRGTLGFELDHTSFDPALAVPLLAVSVFAVSLVLVLVLERLPYARRWLV